jgi:hypothetical protein
LLQVGLQAEETKVPGFGAGLCPGYTISRAILADAVALTRGDRYMTTEFNRKYVSSLLPPNRITPYCAAYNLTSWGYQDCQYEEGDGSYGGMLTKLLFRTLPQYYPRRSAYAHFPFLTPKSMEPHMMERDPEETAKYIWLRPEPLRTAYPIVDYSSVKRILSDSSPYLSSYESQKFAIIQPALKKPRVCAFSCLSVLAKLYGICRRGHLPFPSAKLRKMIGVSGRKNVWHHPLKLLRSN